MYNMRFKDVAFAYIVIILYLYTIFYYISTYIIVTKSTSLY